MAQALTVVFWVGAVLWALFVGPLDFFLLYFIGAGIFVALPSSVAIWGIWAGTNYWRISLTPIAFAIVGIIISAINIIVWFVYSHELPQLHAQQITERFAKTKLAWISDEPLMTPRGPIGVRIRYRISYSVAEPLCDFQANGDNLTANSPPVFFDRTAHSVSPKSSGGCSAGNYDFTDEFMPYFIPIFLEKSNVVANATNRCIRWKSNLPAQEIIRSTEAQPLDFAMFFHGTSTHQITKNTYALADFYKTALQAGGIDCSDESK